MLKVTKSPEEQDAAVQKIVDAGTENAIDPPLLGTSSTYSAHSMIFKKTARGQSIIT